MKLREKLKSDRGFTLVEVMVAMVILGLVVGPMVGGLVVSHRVNAYADEVLKARLAVSSKIEELMASGVDETYNTDVPDDNVVVKVTAETGSTGYYLVKVTYNPPADSGYKPDVSVETYIHAKGA